MCNSCKYGSIESMELSRQLDKMDAAELRNLTATLIAQLAERDAERSAHAALIAKRDAEIKAKQLKIDQLAHEMATLKRSRYDRRSEQLDVMQPSLLDESIDADIEAISLEIEALKEKPASPPKEKPRRVALPALFPRREIRHEPETTQCNCGCSPQRIGEDVSGKHDYTPGVFEVELANRQQSHRKSDQAGGSRQIQLAVRGIFTCRAACRDSHEPHPVRQAQRTRPVSLPQRRTRALTNSARQPNRGVAAAPMGPPRQLSGNRLVPC
jgi:hypothetical protein